MTIIEFNQRDKKFSDIQNGEVFKFRGEFFMKVFYCPERNAVELDSGMGVCFEEDEYVTSCGCAQLMINECDDDEAFCGNDSDEEGEA